MTVQIATAGADLPYRSSHTNWERVAGPAGRRRHRAGIVQARWSGRAVFDGPTTEVVRCSVLAMPRGVAVCHDACATGAPIHVLTIRPVRRGIASVLKLRLRRMGAKRQPSYRIVVAESSSPRDGRFVETIGIYNPKTEPMTLRVDNERAKYWLDRGAQPTDTVRSLLVRTGVVEGRISKEGLAEGYVTEVPRRGVTPEIMQAHGGPAAE